MRLNISIMSRLHHDKSENTGRMIIPVSSGKSHRSLLQKSPIKETMFTLNNGHRNKIVSLFCLDLSHRSLLQKSPIKETIFTLINAEW